VPTDADGEQIEDQELPPAANQPVVNHGPKLGRNDPCWCGSGKKYKHCHGRLD